MIKFAFILFAIAFAQDYDSMDDSDDSSLSFKSMGKCEDECVTFVTCLYDSKNNYTEGQNPVKARDLTWDCLWSIDESWVIERSLMAATKCTIKVYEDAPQSDVEDCYADDVYGPVIGMIVGSFFSPIGCRFDGTFLPCCNLLRSFPMLQTHHVTGYWFLLLQILLPIGCSDFRRSLPRLNCNCIRFRLVWMYLYIMLLETKRRRTWCS